MHGARQKRVIDLARVHRAHRERTFERRARARDDGRLEHANDPAIEIGERVDAHEGRGDGAVQPARLTEQALGEVPGLCEQRGAITRRSSREQRRDMMGEEERHQALRRPGVVLFKGRGVEIPASNRLDDEP
jgi:hypothetical protein